MNLSTEIDQLFFNGESIEKGINECPGFPATLKQCVLYCDHVDIRNLQTSTLPHTSMSWTVSGPWGGSGGGGHHQVLPDHLGGDQ